MSTKVRPFRGQEGKWEVDIRFEWPDGTEYRARMKAPVSSSSAAQKWGEAREREAFKKGKEQVHVEEAKPAPTLAKFFESYIEHCTAERQKPSTLGEKRIMFRAYLQADVGKKPLDKITNADVADIKAALAKLSPKTVNNVLCLLRNMLRHAVELEVIERPACNIKPLKTTKTEMTFYDFDDYARLVEAAKAVDPRTHLVVLLAGDAGLRRGEIIALQWGHVAFGRGVLRIVESETRKQVTTTKGGRAREVPMTSRLLAALKAHRHLKGPRVLYDDDGDGLTTKTVRCWIAKAEKRAGLPVTHRLHVLRHTFCSHLAMKGAPAKAIQELAGHADLTTTMRYMHLSPSARVDAIRLLETPGNFSGLKGATPAHSDQGAPGFGEILEKRVSTPSDG